LEPRDGKEDLRLSPECSGEGEISFCDPMVSWLGSPSARYRLAESFGKRW
jgi:hypothetical protein